MNTDFLREEPDVDVGEDIRLKIEGRVMSLHVVGITAGQIMGPVMYMDRKAGLDRPGGGEGAYPFFTAGGFPFRG